MRLPWKNTRKDRDKIKLLPAEDDTLMIIGSHIWRRGEAPGNSG